MEIGRAYSVNGWFPSSSKGRVRGPIGSMVSLEQTAGREYSNQSGRIVGLFFAIFFLFLFSFRRIDGIAGYVQSASNLRLYSPRRTSSGPGPWEFRTFKTQDRQ